MRLCAGEQAVTLLVGTFAAVVSTTRSTQMHDHAVHV